VRASDRGRISGRKPPATAGRTRMALLKALKEFMEMPPYGHVAEWLRSGLQSQMICVTYQSSFRKNAEFCPLTDQWVGRHFGIAAVATRCPVGTGGRGLLVLHTILPHYSTALQNRRVDGNLRGISGLSERGRKFQVAVRASADGRFTFEIFSVSGEPRTLQVGSQYYATPDDAERAGYAAIAAKGL
jgi:hypothetical protein